MSAASLGGLWSYPSSQAPAHLDYLFIDELLGRMAWFCYIILPDGRGTRACTRHWYQPVSPATLKVKHLTDPPSSWLEYQCKLEGAHLAWTTRDGGILTQQRVPWEERPDWLDTRLAAEFAKMGKSMPTE